jgi:hypothetical protein
MQEEKNDGQGTHGLESRVTSPIAKKTYLSVYHLLASLRHSYHPACQCTLHPT